MVGKWRDISKRFFFYMILTWALHFGMLFRDFEEVSLHRVRQWGGMGLIWPFSRAVWALFVPGDEWQGVAA